MPVLPLQLIEYLQAPVPFLMGIHTDFMATNEGMDCITSAVVVHADQDKVRADNNTRTMLSLWLTYGQLVTPMQVELGSGERSELLPMLPLVRV